MPQINECVRNQPTLLPEHWPLQAPLMQMLHPLQIKVQKYACVFDWWFLEKEKSVRLTNVLCEWILIILQTPGMSICDSRMNKPNVTEKGWKESSVREKTTETEVIQKKKKRGGVGGLRVRIQSGWLRPCLLLYNSCFLHRALMKPTHTHMHSHTAVWSHFSKSSVGRCGGFQCSVIAKENLLLLGPPSAHT